MGKIFVPTRSADDWRKLLADPEKHWRKGFSAMSAAKSWELANGLPPEIRALFGNDAELLLAIPEHKVDLEGGGRPSQCDVFALIKCGGQTSTLAVEAKVDEPFGPTIGEWLNAASAGKVQRLSSICALLGCPNSPPAALRYQLFHRSAAAVIEAARFKTDAAAMVVQSFSATQNWYDDFATFVRYLGHVPERGAPIAHPLPDGRVLTLGWASGALPG